MDARDTTILVVGAALVLVNAAVNMKPCLRGICCINLCLAVRRVNELFTSMRPSHDVLGKLVAHKLERRRAAAARFLYVLAAAVLCLATAGILISLALHTRRWVRLRQIGVMFAGLAALAFVNAAPALLPRLLDVYHGISMLALAAYVGLNLPHDSCVFSYAAALVFRVMFSILNLKVSHTVVWNLVGSCATCVRASYGARGHCAHCSREMFYTSELCAVAIASSAAVAFKLWTVVGIRREIQLGMLKSEASASMSLLGTVCDVAVELDGDMAVARESPAMAALLTGSPEASVAGRPFCDFVPSEAEKSGLREQLSASGARQEASAGTCRVHLSDGLRNPLRVEVFFVAVKADEEEGRRYILGIRGLADDVGSMPTFAPRAGGRPRQHRESARRGTPHTCERFSLEAEDPQASTDVAPTVADAEYSSEASTDAAPTVADAEYPSEAMNLPARKHEDHANRRFPEFMLTTQRAKCEEVLVCMSSWNVKVPRNICCPFHAYVLDVRKVAREKLMRLPCIGDFPHWSERPAQCQECGVLVDAEQVQADCHFCGLCEPETRARRLDQL